MGREEFIAALERGIGILREADRELLIVHHNDADGLSSAAVLRTALSRAGFATEEIALERVHPPIIERIHARFAGPIIYVDLGGRAAPLISEINKSKNLTIILDHHLAEGATDPRVLNLSTELFGISGEEEISAATAAYLFARVLSEGNDDLAYLGVIGAVGDSHDRSGRLVGENRKALETAVARGDIDLAANKTDNRESYTLRRFGRPLSLAELARALTTLGAAGYYADGPRLGVQVCLEGPSEETESKLQELEKIKERAFAEVTEDLRAGGLQQGRYVQWFHVHDRFDPMGVKIIGEFCMQIRDEDFIDPDKYIAGFQNMGRTIPGLGEFDWDLAKISMRVPSPLERKIVVDRTMPGLAYLLPEAAKAVGGSIDACHDYAAAALIPTGLEKQLIAELDKLIEAYQQRG